jgi:predicted HicB family RNase H-like nuclease
VLQMMRDVAQNAEQQAPLTGTRFMQCRLPVAHYEWLRYRAFLNRTSMNSIVLQAITEMQEENPDVETPIPLAVTSGTSGGVKFNVRLSESTYEWLRTKAFISRGSINQLLIAALATYRQRQDANA